VKNFIVRAAKRLIATASNSLSLLLAFFLASTYAFAYTPAELGLENLSFRLGDSYTLQIPAKDFSFAKGTFNGKNIEFYQVFAKPEQQESITRGEFLKLLLENTDIPAITKSAESNAFPDVQIGHEFFTQVQNGYNLGLINGYSDGLFHPYDTLTRAQAAKILINYFSPAQSFNNLREYSDLSSSHSLYSQMQSAILAGIFRGYDDGLIRPDRALSIGEAEIIISRISQREITKPITERKYFRGFIAIHRLDSAGLKNFNITLENSQNSSLTQNLFGQIDVTSREYPTISFSLSSSSTKLFGSNYQDTTWDMIYGSMKNHSSEQLWEGPFIIPTTGEISLGFGDKLNINGKYSGSHFGIDYANATGTEVYASNKGIVTLSDYTPSYGNTIVIDHGQNIFTMYLHMSELKVPAGQTVNKGDLIGLIGSTGIASGPHLHFTGFIGDLIVDTDPWLIKGP